MKKAYVTGGSGFVGRNLIRELRKRKIKVIALSRSDKSADLVESLGARPAMGDLSDPALLQAEMMGCDVVFHCAAKVDEWGSPESFYEANVTGTDNALAAAKAAGVSCFVHVGTEAAYADGKSNLTNLNESRALPEKPLPRYPASKALSEQHVRAANADGFRTVVVRPRLIWGDDDSSVLAQIEAAVKAGRMMWLDGGKQETSTCHVRNLVHGMLLAAEKGKGGGAYFLTDGDTVNAREFISAMLNARGVNAPDKNISKWLVKGMVAVCEPLWTALNIQSPPPANSVVLALMGQDVTIDDSLARRELGYENVIGREEGLATIQAAPAR